MGLPSLERRKRGNQAQERLDRPAYKSALPPPFGGGLSWTIVKPSVVVKRARVRERLAQHICRLLYLRGDQETTEAKLRELLSTEKPDALTDAFDFALRRGWLEHGAPLKLTRGGMMTKRRVGRSGTGA